jgi:hypothetical protein
MRSILTILFSCVLSGPRVITQATKGGFIKTSDGVRIFGCRPTKLEI